MENTLQEHLVVLGTRPETIKLAPILRRMEESEKITPYVVHTGQHYDEELVEYFFQDLHLSKPDKHLHVGSTTQGKQTADALRGIEEIILERSPATVSAVGDTNAVLSAAIAASKTDSQFCHIEAGLRSFDRSMPEEINRILADHAADLNFAPTKIAMENLMDEGLVENVELVGNTIVEACTEHVTIAEENSSILNDLGLEMDRYVVATIHREINTENRDRLESIVSALSNQQFPVILPAHPRTSSALDKYSISAGASLTIIDPLDYLDFLKLLNHARVVVTDSGGVQEEASILEVPCLTVRPNTERPETVESNVNELVSPADLRQRLRTLYTDTELQELMMGDTNLYGDGSASQRILNTLLQIS